MHHLHNLKNMFGKIVILNMFMFGQVLSGLLVLILWKLKELEGMQNTILLGMVGKNLLLFTFVKVTRL